MACAFGIVFLAGMNYGQRRRTDAAMWLLLAALQIGVAYYASRGERRQRR